MHLWPMTSIPFRGNKDWHCQCTHAPVWWLIRNYIFNEWFAFALSDRFDREDFLTCSPSKWQYWCDAYRFLDLYDIMECLEWRQPIIFDTSLIDRSQRCDTLRITTCFNKNRYHKKNYIDLEEFWHKTPPESRCWISTRQQTHHVIQQFADSRRSTTLCD